ncbi:MAG: potassium channel family protein [Acidimicrobiales bacterium]
MLVALVDLFLTTLHPDVDGPMAGAVQGGLWRLVVAGDRRRTQRRRLMALAGPLMMVVTFAVWVLTFMLGFALMVWPFLGELFQSDPKLGSLGFIDALYFSGTTVSTLGLGDVSPASRPLQLLTVVASLSGFSMLTGIVAYLLEVLGSLHSRVRLALRVGEDTDGRYDGAEVLAGWLADEDLGDVRQRLEKWGDLLRDSQDEMHRFPLVSVCYRSSDPHQDPEPAVRSVAQTVIAGLLLASDDRYRRLRTSLRGLDRAVTRFMVVMARQYLDRGRMAELADPQPSDADRDHIDAITRRLHDLLGAECDPDDQTMTIALELACRTRVFLDAFHRLTGWQSSDDDHADQPVSVPTPR